MRIPIESTTSYRGRNSRPNLPALLGFTVAALSAGAVGAAFSPALSPAAASWYATLSKPRWLPPDHWLGPVWLVLYLLMGAAAWLIWRERYHRGRGTAMAAYGLQLLLNMLWAPLFFGWHNIGAGLFVSVALWVAIAWTLREFARVQAAAALILVPYLIWVALATKVNLDIWMLNQ
jgi:tryptophan-rich sensory protein